MMRLPGALMTGAPVQPGLLLTVGGGTSVPGPGVTTCTNQAPDPVATDGVIVRVQVYRLVPAEMQDFVAVPWALAGVADRRVSTLNRAATSMALTGTTNRCEVNFT